MMSNALRQIQGLQDYQFYMPSYQRAYRWGEDEVNALLNDILDFAIKEKSEEEFYCLQPVVVQEYEEGYKVIDGQQRLTTLFLIVKFLDKGRNLFSLTYETRKNSWEFLQNIDNRENSGDNIDFYHFSKAHKTIKEFFKQHQEKQDLFLKTLLERCKVLWYETKDNENNVFVRLNIGKIPLTEAENIKALFLSRSNSLDSDALKERADLWYESEIQARENRDFRYCVLNKIDEEKDIENKNIQDDILRIKAYLKAIVPYKKQNYYLFNHFYKHYKDGTLDDQWKELEKAIKTLSGFAGGKESARIDREIFHYLGFLVLSGEHIDALYKVWKDDTDKELFAKRLLEKIQKKISGIKNIEELNYQNQNDKVKIREILLLFNLEYLICDASSNEYFKFNRFVLEQWTLEHIYAQNSKSIKEAIKNKDNASIIQWLQELLGYIKEDENLHREVESAIKRLQENNDIPKEEKLFDKIDENFKDNADLHTIQNLTLLDKDSNSKIGNQIFSKKRLAIQKLGEQDKLIPIATKKVFEKVFSKDKGHPDVFEEKDQQDYLDAIKEHLRRYVKENR